ncbi:MAG: hypothetical protein H6682_07615 [Candidatus Eisenbacteria bacterium]|nr:hypothetical protein [Candidatus Eisenbacteria bacterium]
MRSHVRPVLVRPALVVALALVASVLAIHGCSSNDEGSPPNDDESVRILQVEPSTKLASSVAVQATAALADSIDAWADRVNPVPLPEPGNDLQELLEEEISPYELLRVTVSDEALSRRPFALQEDDLDFFVIDGPAVEGRGTGRSASGSTGPLTPSRDPSEGDSDLKDAVGEFIDLVEGTGLDVGELRNAYDATRFHDEADFPGGLPEGTRDGATFTWDNSVFWNAAWHNGGLFIWWDGYNHMVLASRHVTALKNREFVGDDFDLGGGAETVLHELGHIIMSRTGCAVDDADDLMAAVLERVMINRIEMELAAGSTGTPKQGDVSSYSDQVAELVEIGGVNCLRDLMWGLPAEDLTVDAPETVRTGQTFDAEFFAKRIGGDPASNEWIWTWVDTQIQVVRLNGVGLGSRTITAPNEPGEIRIRVKALGKEAETRVQVVGDPVGACCLLGECSLRSEAGCTETQGSWLGTGESCSPNPCPQPGACCLHGECSVAADSLACVTGGGDWRGAGVPCEAETCPPVLGACCLPGGTCLVSTESACGDQYLGDDTICEPNPCPQPGACCIGSLCGITLEAQCDGEFLGEGTVCDPDPCFVPGACCLEDGTCEMTILPDCDGEFQGEETSCDPNVCPRPGACCDPDGECVLALESDCDESFLGKDTICDPNPCPQPPEGACCWGNSNERCTVRSETRCATELGGEYLGDGTACFSEPCTDPLAGACCLSAGRCEYLRESSCDGTFMGVGVSCTPDLCDTPSEGACCFDFGSCQLLTASACASSPGTYLGDGTVCTPNPCTQPGACCFPSGTCQVLDESPCTSQNGTYLGNGTNCDPNPCHSGACCIQSQCSVTYESLCDGEYQGNDTTCDPNPCPQTVTGACCIAICTITTSEDCASQGGAYQGDGSTCTPSPCGTGACCLPAGDCTIDGESSCTQEGGIFQGSGSFCDPSDPCDFYGACCMGNACTLSLPSSCDGDFQGLGTACDPGLTCPEGACCTVDGCAVVPMTACDGEFLGNEVDCDPDPCAGACCLSFGCEVRNPFGCEFDFGDFQGAGTSCTPDPCPQAVELDFLESGVTHFQTFSVICVRLQAIGTNVEGGILTFQITGGTNPGTEEVVVGGGGAITLDRDIFVYGTYGWHATRLDLREQTYELTGDVSGSIVVDAENRPCSR